MASLVNNAAGAGAQGANQNTGASVSKGVSDTAQKTGRCCSGCDRVFFSDADFNSAHHIKDNEVRCGASEMGWTISDLRKEQPAKSAVLETAQKANISCRACMKSYSSQADFNDDHHAEGGVVKCGLGLTNQTLNTTSKN